MALHSRLIQNNGFQRHSLYELVTQLLDDFFTLCSDVACIPRQVGRVMLHMQPKQMGLGVFADHHARCGRGGQQCVGCLQGNNGDARLTSTRPRTHWPKIVAAVLIAPFTLAAAASLAGCAPGGVSGRGGADEGERAAAGGGGEQLVIAGVSRRCR